MCLSCRGANDVPKLENNCKCQQQYIKGNNKQDNNNKYIASLVPDQKFIKERDFQDENLQRFRAENEEINDNYIEKQDKNKMVGPCTEMVTGSYEAKTKILELINGGSFGDIYLGKCLLTDNLVAVKAEQQGTGSEKIMQEGNMYYKLQGGPGIPHVYWYGMHGSEYNFLVMDLLGPSLAHLFHICDERFTVPAVLKLTVKILNVITYVHSQDILHRDISPDNFVIGRPGSSMEHEVYLIDFGLAKKCNSAGKLVLPGKGRYSFQLSRPMVGTPRFASLGVHQGVEEGRRDDLESLAYICIYFLKGSLPWQGSNTSSETLRYAEIAESKAKTSAPELCIDLPNEFATFLDYIRSLRPSDIPDYEGLVKLFKTAAEKRNIDLQNVLYDWTNRIVK